MILKEYILVKNNNELPSLFEKSEYEIPLENVLDREQLCDCISNIYKLDISFVEYVFIIGINKQNKILGIIEAGKGNTFEVTNNIKEIFMFLLLIGADKFIHIHNHPQTEILECSKDDIQVIQTIKKSAELLGIELMDALIITDKDNIRYTDIC